MKYAKSLRWAGMLVPADGSTHDSYLKLGLKCDACDSPVFLNSGTIGRIPHKRKLKSGEVVDVKGSDVDAFFAHFKDKGKEEQDFQACELRVKSLQGADISRRDTTARNQRLKKFQSHFWKLLKFSHKMPRVDQDIEFAEQGFIDSCPVNDPINYRRLKLEKFCDRYMDYFRHNKAAIEGGITNTLREIAGSSDEEIATVCQGNEYLENFVRSITFGIEAQMQGAIAKEALGFLLHKSSRTILTALAKKALCDLIIWFDKYELIEPDMAALGINLFSPVEISISTPVTARISAYSKLFERVHRSKPDQLNNLFKWMTVDLLCILITVPWGDAFSSLEDQSNDYETRLKVAQKSSGVTAGFWHYTFNTGHTKFESFGSRKEYLAVLDILSAELKELEPGAQISFSVPETSGYCCKVTLSRGAAVFDVMKGDTLEGLMTTCAVAWTSSGADEAWEVMSPTYENVIRNLIPGLKSKESIRPQTLPWMGTILIPNVQLMPYPGWLASFEQCMAHCLIGRG